MATKQKQFKSGDKEMDNEKGIDVFIDVTKRMLEGTWISYVPGDPHSGNWKQRITQILSPQKWTFKAINSNKSLWVEIRVEESPVGWFRLAYFPMCKYMMVSTEAEVSEKVRGRGLGTVLHQLRLEIAKMNQIKWLLCTARADNQTQVKILTKFGWKIKESMKVKPWQEEEYEVDLWLKDLQA